jgi:hypothetical protein
MQQEGLLRSWVPDSTTPGRRRDMFLFAALRGEWTRPG